MTQHLVQHTPDGDQQTWICDGGNRHPVVRAMTPLSENKEVWMHDPALGPKIREFAQYMAEVFKWEIARDLLAADDLSGATRFLMRAQGSFLAESPVSSRARALLEQWEPMTLGKPRRADPPQPE
jgi:hypothetical protein